MDPASVLQVIQFSASVLSALQTISLRISHAAEFLTDIRQYTQHLHHLLVTVSQSLDNGNTSDPLPDALIGNILADLQEVQLELSKITRYFDKPSDFMVAIPESGILEPLNVESTSAKLGRTARRVKGKIVVSYKQDHITDLKKRIKDHVDILNVVCSARTLMQSGRMMAMMEAICSSAVPIQHLQSNPALPDDTSTTTVAIGRTEWRPARSVKVRKQLTNKCLRLNFGIGSISTAASQHRIIRIDQETGPCAEAEEQSIDLLVSLPYLSMALQLSLGSVTSMVGVCGTKFFHGLSVRAYNPNRAVWDAFNNCDVVQMRSMFERGEAHPTDVQSTGSMLSYAIFLESNCWRRCCHPSPLEDRVAMFKLLQGDLDEYLNGRPPLMSLLEAEMKPTEVVFALFLSRTSESDFADILSDLLPKLCGRPEWIKTYVLPRIGLLELQSLDALGRWVLAFLAETDPEIKRTLEAIITEDNWSKTPNNLGLHINNTRSLSLPESDLISEIRQAGAYERARLFEHVARDGSPAILRLLLEAGLHEGLEKGFWLSCNDCPFIRQCMQLAVGFDGPGNIMNLLPLMEHDTVGFDTHATCLPVLDLVISKTVGNKSLSGQELEVIERLADSPKSRSQNIVSHAIGVNCDEQVIERLLKSGCGPAHTVKPVANTYSRRDASHPETIQAVLSQNETAMRLLIQHSYDINAPSHVGGSTALYLAIDWGWKKGVEILLSGGADLDIVRREPQIISAWDLVRSNRSSMHPRSSRLKKLAPNNWFWEGDYNVSKDLYRRAIVHPKIDMDTDDEIFNMIRGKAIERGLVDDVENGDPQFIETVEYVAPAPRTALLKEQLQSFIRTHWISFRRWFDQNPPYTWVFLLMILVFTLLLSVFVQIYRAAWWLLGNRRLRRRRVAVAVVVLGVMYRLLSR